MAGSTKRLGGVSVISHAVVRGLQIRSQPTTVATNASCLGSRCAQSGAPVSLVRCLVGVLRRPLRARVGGWRIAIDWCYDKPSAAIRRLQAAGLAALVQRALWTRVCCICDTVSLTLQEFASVRIETWHHPEAAIGPWCSRSSWSACWSSG